MIPVLSREDMRAFDADAIRRGVPGLVLMENAGRGATDVLVRELLAGDARGRRVVVLCGTGNNGGDGFVVARHLLLRSARVTAWLVGDEGRMTSDARANRDAYVSMGGVLGAGSLGNAMDGAHAIVDGLFGTGLDRPIDGEIAEFIRFANAVPVPRLALDIPSGLHANRGVVLGEAIRADVTVTFGFQKMGLHTGTGAALAGKVFVVDIGVPQIPRSEPRAFLVTAEDVRARWRPRAADVHKYRAGHVAILAGSPGKIGAARLAAHGALRAGAGAVTIVSWPEVCDALAAQVREIMLAPIDGDLAGRLAGKASIVIGPGLGLDARARDAVVAALEGSSVPCVIDADALGHFMDDPTRLARWGERLVLTPHAGELARLFGVTGEIVEADRFDWANRAARDTGAVVVLKGPRTLVARPEHPILINPTGGPALATAGSGDVLAGVVGALLVEHEPHIAAWMGAWLHGRAGDAWAEAHGDRGLLAHEIADRILAPM